MRYQFSKQVLVQTDLDPAIVLDLQSGRYFEANLSAHQVILGIQQGATKPELLARLKQRFQASEEALSQDLETLLNDWLQKAWIEAIP